MRLTDIAVKNARPSGKQVKLSDGKGLYLLVHPNGSKYWQVAYRYDGKQKVFSLGTYPNVPLAEARTKLVEVKSLLANGIDPLQQKKAVKAEECSDFTFEAVARVWHDKMSVSERWIPQHSERILNSLINHLFPAIGSKSITKLTTRDLLRPLRKIEAKGQHETASRLKQRMTAIMRYAVQEDMITHNPANELGGTLITPKRTHYPALELEQIPDLLARIDAYNGRRLTKLALKLTMLVFIRSSELRFARWPEIDFKNALWVIPTEREEIENVRYSERGSKMRIPHYVPLSSQSIEILKELKDISYDVSDGKGLIFIGAHDYRKPMSENTINKSLRQMGYDTQKDICGHGFRTMACSSLVESGIWTEDAIERQMSHKEQNNVRAAYTHKAKHITQRRLMLQWWADYLDANKEIHIMPFDFARTNN
ncbi:integrase arm-type DNA-binding domain-containing protein [Klebsiella pneumoniae]|uniref:Integrase arm-type DNA-binding domain-containing protein n=3 Tax=Enterobacteriaceae TaxID=543 RepID=A0ABZ2E0C4_RAOOR|nr:MULTISPECIES: integrase arm-type DNA-binding domain-containing protein [Enterobacteriaceae]HAT2206897.1 tyrosine-type recombinase/integrase [Kluyvera intermedia]HAT2278796.1 tyrosine-type recombinase/integrase [Raoultella ornithinolytica]AKL15187.1 integrase [Phytobacter ursingii]EJK5914847.1 tyrosine-type recombinase/integrase [Escherichia coli]ELO7118822.1 tyrosine-type recombinase/integrase [Escherichia coli]